MRTRLLGADGAALPNAGEDALPNAGEDALPPASIEDTAPNDMRVVRGRDVCTEWSLFPDVGPLSGSLALVDAD